MHGPREGVEPVRAVERKADDAALAGREDGYGAHGGPPGNWAAVVPEYTKARVSASRPAELRVCPECAGRRRMQDGVRPLASAWRSIERPVARDLTRFSRGQTSLAQG